MNPFPKRPAINPYPKHFFHCPNCQQPFDISQSKSTSCTTPNCQTHLHYGYGDYQGKSSYEFLAIYYSFIPYFGNRFHLRAQLTPDNLYIHQTLYSFNQDQCILQITQPSQQLIFNRTKVLSIIQLKAFQ